MATFNSKLEEYKVDFQHKIQQAEINARKATDQAQLDTSTGLQNNAKSIEVELQKDSIEIQKYSAEVQSYGVEVNAVLQEYMGQISTILQVHQGLMLESQNLQKLYEIELQLHLG